jgi:hypothetical protein
MRAGSSRVTKEVNAIRGFRDRQEAGGLLAEKLTAYANRPGVIVLALPRGGVRSGSKFPRPSMLRWTL